MISGNIFNIQRFSVHDGPGIRTTVFLKGCNNRCAWCHNPESLNMAPEIQFYPERCIGCGQCLMVCPNGVHEVVDGQRIIHREKCVGCGACVEVCYSNGIELTGKTMSSQEVMDEVLKDKVYYDSSNGGVTFSGGEPVLQRDFLKELLVCSKELSLHTTIQTAGNYEWEWLAELLPYIDLVMYDVKAYHNEIHIEYVGSHNERILRNLENLSKSNTNFVVRTPIITGVNDKSEEIEAIAKMIRNYPQVLYYELIPYHNLGVSKNIHLGKTNTYDFKAPSKEILEQLVMVAKRYLSDVRCNL